MAMFIGVGIGEKFSYNRRKWMVYDIREGMYTCKTLDNDKKSEEVKVFNTTEMLKIIK
jgi:hypothetical protein